MKSSSSLRELLIVKRTEQAAILNSNNREVKELQTILEDLEKLDLNLAETHGLDTSFFLNIDIESLASDNDYLKMVIKKTDSEIENLVSIVEEVLK